MREEGSALAIAVSNARGRQTSELPTLLDDLIPTYDAASTHTIWVAADPARVYQVARHGDLGRPWLVRLLTGLRTGPVRLASALRRQPRPAPADRRPPVGPIAFTVVAESPGEEFVLGLRHGR